MNVDFTHRIGDTNIGTDVWLDDCLEIVLSGMNDILWAIQSSDATETDLKGVHAQLQLLTQDAQAFLKTWRESPKESS